MGLSKATVPVEARPELLALSFLTILVLLCAQIYSLIPVNSGGQKPKPTTPHAWLLQDKGGQFEFSVELHADGHHSYSARLINLPFPCPNELESGTITSQEWAELKSFQPKTVSQQLDWGTLKRNGLTVKLSCLDWAALANSAAGKAEHRLSMKAKRL